MYKTVIWATDGSEGADAALPEALRLTAGSGRIVVVHCDHRLQGRAAAYPALADEEDIRIRLRTQLDALKADGVDAQLVIRSSHHEPAEVVASIAKKIGADVIVCGTRGFRAFAGAFLGSFTQGLLHVAPCPVLAVPLHTAAETGSAREKAEVPA